MHDAHRHLSFFPCRRNPHRKGCGHRQEPDAQSASKQHVEQNGSFNTLIEHLFLNHQCSLSLLFSKQSLLNTNSAPYATTQNVTVLPTHATRLRRILRPKPPILPIILHPEPSIRPRNTITGSIWIWSSGRQYRIRRAGFQQRVCGGARCEREDG